MTLLLPLVDWILHFSRATRASYSQFDDRRARSCICWAWNEPAERAENFFASSSCQPPPMTWSRQVVGPDASSCQRCRSRLGSEALECRWWQAKCQLAFHMISKSEIEKSTWKQERKLGKINTCGTRMPMKMPAVTLYLYSKKVYMAYLQPLM